MNTRTCRYFFVLLAFLGLSSPLRAVSTSDQGALQEISPYVIEIEILRNELFLEVFLKGKGDLGCYDQREYEVRRKDPDSTVVIPRLKRSKPDTPCKPSFEEFRDKVADLDAAADSSYHIRVLGYRGWVTREIARKAP